MRPRILTAVSVLCVVASCRAADPVRDVEQELQAALAAAEARVKADANDVRALLDRGDALFFLGRFDEAIRDYDRMLELEPRLGPTHWQRGLALHFAGRYDDAAKQFERYYELDQSDRENGIWRFYAHVEKAGVEAARKALLPYTQPDREPLPVIYRLCEGKATPEDVLKTANAPDLTDDERQKRRFYAALYVGLDAAIVRDDAAAATPHLRTAVNSAWPRKAGYGPTFMWHIARLSLSRLDASDKHMPADESRP